MTGFASVLRYVAFTLMALFGLLGGLFVAGYAFEDPGGWAAVGLTALVAVFTLADSAFGIVQRDELGPVDAITVFTLVVALAFLGLRRPGLAGLLMIVAALSQLAATVVGIAVHDGGEGPGPGVALLGTSSGVVVLPAFVVGSLFLVAGTLSHEPLRPGGTARTRTAH